jgi:hypothetical protein
MDLGGENRKAHHGTFVRFAAFAAQRFALTAHTNLFCKANSILDAYQLAGFGAQRQER